jgi:hypothetical protein
VSICFLKNNHFLSRSNMKKAENFSLYFLLLDINFQKLDSFGKIYRYLLVVDNWIFASKFRKFSGWNSCPEAPTLQGLVSHHPIKNHQKNPPIHSQQTTAHDFNQHVSYFSPAKFYSKNKISSFCRWSKLWYFFCEIFDGFLWKGNEICLRFLIWK